MRNSVESLIQLLGIENGSLDQPAGTFRKVGFTSRGQIVQDADGSLSRQMASEVAANEAGASCD